MLSRSASGRWTLGIGRTRVSGGVVGQVPYTSGPDPGSICMWTWCRRLVSPSWTLVARHADVVRAREPRPLRIPLTRDPNRACPPPHLASERKPAASERKPKTPLML